MVDPSSLLGLSRLLLLLHRKLRASVAAPQANQGLRPVPRVWSLLSSRGSKHFYKHPWPSSTPAVVLFALYILLLAEVLCLILRHPARGNSPTPDVEEARTQPLPGALTPGKARPHTTLVLSPTFPTVASGRDGNQRKCPWEAAAELVNQGKKGRGEVCQIWRQSLGKC